ncbi:MAG: hypothetical protein ACYC8T_07295 [Myxococcaceae bacterium]
MRALLWLAALGAALSGCKASFTSGDPLAYPCSRDGGGDLGDGGGRSADGGDRQCPGGWVCGLEGRCHDPDAGSDYLCESDRDCAADWRCGLERRCHDRTVPSDYLCTLDSDCEGQWRCGPDGRCGGQTADEALRPGLGPLPLARLYPWPLERAPDLFTAGYPYPFDGGTLQPFAVVQGSSLRVGAQAALPGMSLFYGVWSPDLVDAGQAPIRALGYLGGTLLVLRDGALTLIPSQAGPSVFPMSAGELRVARGMPPLAVAFDDAGYWLSWVQAGNVVADPVARVLAGPDGGARALRDFADVEVPGCASGIVAASDELLGFAPRGPSGLFQGAGDAGPVPVADPAWEFTFTSSLFDPGAVPFAAKALRPRGKNLLAIAGELQGDPAVVLVELVPPGGPGCLGRPGLRRLLGPAPLCASAETVVDFQPLEDGTTTPMVIVRCGARGRERTLLLTVPAGASPHQVDTQVVSDDSSMYGENLQVSRAAAGAPAYAGSHGQLWLGSAAFPPVPLLPDQAPQFLTSSVLPDGGASALLGMKHGVWQLAGDTESPYFYQYRAGDLRTVGAVEGRPWWIVGERGLIWDGKAKAWVAYPQASGPPLETPLIASAVTTFDGGAELVVASADALYGVDLGSGNGELEWKAVPSPGATIRSLVVYSPRAADGGTPLFEGYLLAQDRLFALAAQTQRRWQATELGLPDGDPAKLWADGHRGRLGFRDGTVLSLPARVPIAPALPDREAVDFAQVCGQGYALSPGGLYRLDSAADGGPVGAWAKVDLGALISGGRDGGDFGFAGGRLHALENDLFLFSRFGGAARLKGPAVCP